MKFKIPSIAEIIANSAERLPAVIDLQGWNSDHPIFDRLVAETKPKVVIEVGSWKGRSARHLALATANRAEIDEVSGISVPSPSEIYCVDTWLGGLDHITSDKPQDDLARDAFGSPRLYEQFLRNFADEPDFAKRIFPIQNTSLNGARLLACMGVSAGLIYIDGSHEYQDAYADLCAYIQLLAPGGVIFGDDFRAFPGVFTAILRFSHEYGFKIEEVENNFWILRQP
jgi:predicted O-methyltransferase YrrM